MAYTIEQWQQGIERARAAGDAKAVREMTNEVNRLISQQDEGAPRQARLDDPGQFESAGRGLADSVAFGFDDEIAAGISTGFGTMGDYGAEQQRLEKSKQLAQDVNPWSFGAGQVGGAIPTMFVPGLNVARGATLAAKLGKGAMVGAGMGAAHGAGTAGPGQGTDGAPATWGEALANRGIGAGVGGVAGGALGAAVPFLAHKAGGALGRVRNAATTNREARRLGTTPEMLRTAGHAMEADNTLGAVGQANIARAGREGMLADAGPSSRTLLDTAAQHMGPGQSVVKKNIGDRVARDTARFNQARVDALGGPVGETAAKKAIRTSSQSARQAGYSKTYATPVNPSHPGYGPMARMITDGVDDSVVKASNSLESRLAALEGRSPELIELAEDGSFIGTLTVRQIDNITRGLNELAERGAGLGKTGGYTPEGMLNMKLGKAIRDHLKVIVPSYKEALATAADPIRQAQGVTFGYRALRGMPRDQFASLVDGFTPVQMKGVAQGMGSYLDDVMAKVQVAVSDPDVPAGEALKGIKLFSSRANREMISTVIGRSKADRLFSELDEITRTFEMRAGLARNSATFPRMAANELADNMAEPGMIGSLMEGAPLKSGQRAVQTVFETTPQDLAKRKMQTYGDLAQFLTRKGADATDAQSAATRAVRNDALSERVTDLVSKYFGGSQVTSPLTQNVNQRAIPRIQQQ